MRGTIVVAARELVAQRAFIGASAVIAVLVVVAPWVPGMSRWVAEDVRAVVVLIVGFGFTLIASLLLGATVVGKELAEGRFGFYLSRPLGGTSIWLGKQLGALLTVLCCEFLVILPLAAFHGLVKNGTVKGLPDLAAVVNLAALLLIVTPACVMAAAHVAAVIWRARSGWIALEFAALASGALIAWRAWRPMHPLIDWAHTDSAQIVIPCGIVATAIILIASWAASVWGRSDLHRTHAALSVVVSVLVLAASATTLGLSRWATSTGIDDVYWVDDLTASPSGQWIALRGGTKRLLPLRRAFLYNHASKMLVNITASPESRWGGRSVSFSNNGRWAGWLEDVGGGQYQAVVASLHTDRVEITRTRLFLSAHTEYAISDNGRWLAVRERREFSEWERSIGRTWDVNSVYELPTGRLVFLWHTNQAHEAMPPIFVSEDTVRTYVAPASNSRGNYTQVLQVIDLDVNRGQAMEVATLEGQIRLDSIVIDGLHDRALIEGSRQTPDTWRLAVVEGPSHDLTFELDLDAGPHVGRALSDGRIASWRRIGRRIEILLLNGRGETDKVIDLGQGSGAEIGYEVEPGRLMVSRLGHPPRFAWGDGDVVEVELEQGRTTQIGRSQLPVWNIGRLGRVHFLPAPGSAITRCFGGRNGELKIWDPASRQLDVVVPGHTWPRTIYRCWPFRWW